MESNVYRYFYLTWACLLVLATNKQTKISAVSPEMGKQSNWH